jgi:tetratricopeptide (TPR) repeat protein
MRGYEDALEAFRSGDNDRARELSGQALSAAERERDLAGQVEALCMLARVALREADLGAVRELAGEARARASGDSRLERMPLHMQAVAARMSGSLVEARALYEESIALNQSLGEERMVAAEFHNLAYVELRDGRPDRARELFKQARDEAKRTGYEALNPYLVGDLAVIAAVDGDATTAARLAGAAAAAFAASGQVPDPDDAAEQQRLRDQLTRDLSADTLRALYAEGANLRPEEILDDPSESGWVKRRRRRAGL